MPSMTTCAAVEAPAAKASACRSGFHARLNHAADIFYYHLGFWVARHTKLTVLMSTALVILCCIGFSNFSTETEGKELWVPKASQAKEDEIIVNENFEVDLNFALFMVAAHEEGGNVLTKEILDIVFELDKTILALETSEGSTFAHLCITEPDGVTCSLPAKGITRFWNNDYQTYKDTVETDTDVLAAINVDTFPDGQAVAFEAIFGNSVTYDEGGAISAAEAFIQWYNLREDDDTLTWEADYQTLMADEVETYTDRFKLTYLTGRSIDDALAESISGEVFLFVITYIIMVIFVQCVLGRCFAGPVRRRTSLGVGGVLCVLAAGLAAYGINSGFGVPFTSLVQTLPFVLIGIGVDDMFVIVAAFDHTDPNLPVEERVALALKRCGISVTYTSLTNFVAFMLGSTTTLPAVEYFCLYAGTAILFDFFLQVTAFVALLAMDTNRQKAGKPDCCCCFTSSKASVGKEETVKRGVDNLTPASGTSKCSEHGASAAIAPATAKNTLSAVGLSDIRLGRLGKFMKNKYTPFLLSTKGKALVLLGTTGLLAAGIYGVTQATQGFDVVDLAPHGHFARDHVDTSRDYALEFDTQYVTLNIYTPDVDYTDFTVQASIQATDELMLEQTYVEGPLQSWLASFLAWANSTGYSANVSASGGYPVYDDPNTFYAALADFLDEDSNARFESELVYNDDGLIKISRSGVFLKGITDADKRVESMLDARHVTDQSKLEPEPFAFTPIFVLIEQFLVIYDELITNFALALVAVAVLSLLILGRVAIVAVVCFSVAMIDVELLGFVYHYGLEVNGITVILLIMAVGLVVDYMVHIVHYVLHQSPSIPKNDQIARALGEIGPSVTVGAATTFLGIMPMAFASNFVFRVFFRVFILIILLGFYHGVVFIPVALSLGPGRTVSKVGVTTEDEPSEGESKARDALGKAGLTNLHLSHWNETKTCREGI